MKSIPSSKWQVMFAVSPISSKKIFERAREHVITSDALKIVPNTVVKY